MSADLLRSVRWGGPADFRRGRWSAKSLFGVSVLITRALIAVTVGLALIMDGLVAGTEALALKDIAGVYYFGDGLGVNCRLKVTAGGRFEFKWTGCLGTYDQNGGGALLKDGILHLKPQKPNVQEGFQGTPTEFFPVRWGARLYLVPTNDIVGFCSEVNQGSEPRKVMHGEYYLREKDADKPVAGRPAVPEPWKRFLLAKPVRGKITELVGAQEAWMDQGAASGLLEGMILTAQQRGDVGFSQVRVVAVEQGRSRIKCEWKDSKLGFGQTVTSRFHE